LLSLLSTRGHCAFSNDLAFGNGRLFHILAGAKMSLIYILIVCVTVTRGISVTTAEFYGSQACETARAAAQSLNDDVKSVCVNKGVGK
jgi:hypothetical protein